MPDDSPDSERLHREIDYYRRQLDELTGENFKLDVTATGLRHELKKKLQGFSLLTGLQQAIGANQEISSIFETTIEAINSTLGMDKTVVLTPTDEEHWYRPSQWIGFPQEETGRFPSLSIRFPPEFARDIPLLLVNKSSEPTPLIEEIRAAFTLPYFVCLPVMGENALIGLLLSGRLMEAQPFFPPLDQGDVDTFQAIADLIAASIGKFRLAVLEETDRLKTQFFANISHEFRTPITLSLGPLDQMLKERYGDVPDAIRNQLLVVQRNQERLLGLINQILDLSKLEAGSMQLKAAPMLDMNRFVEERIVQFHPVAEKEGIELRVSLDPQVNRAELFIDGEMFDKLLSNLLSNAFKFTRQGYVEVATEVHGGTFRLGVSDTGMGIKQDQLPHIFDRFRQADGSESREHAGTGLGLALIKEIARLHGGDVAVRSQYGKGSRFQVLIPLGKAHLDPASVIEFVEEELKTAAGSHKVITVREGATDTEGADQANQEAEAAFDPEKSTILYVEDNPDLRNHVRDLLAAHYNVFLAVDGQDGLEKVRKYRPDLVLTDQMMPRMSGRSLLQEIRDHPELRLIPVVFLTARAGTEARIESLDAGADDYLAKPFDEGELQVRIRNLLQARAQERELEALNRELREASERKSRFLASMSHELRTPMNAIMGFSGIVLRKAGGVLPERQQDNLTKVIQSADHLLELINGLLDLSKIEAGRMDVKAERFDVEKLIADSCGEVSPLVEPDVKLDFDVSDDIGEANMDQGRLRQIVINLLSNALKFTEKGKVTVRVTKEGQADEKGFLVMAVSDTGVGIPEDSLDTIFEEFQQVKGSDLQRKGTGLGLPITKGFAELLGGSISVESDVGKGSTFTVQIPMVYKESPELEDEPDAKTRSGEVPFAYPPPEELTTLFEFAQKGKIVAVREKIDRIEKSDERYLPFVNRVREFAKDFDMEQICDFLKLRLK